MNHSIGSWVLPIEGPELHTAPLEVFLPRYRSRACTLAELPVRQEYSVISLSAVCIPPTTCAVAAGDQLSRYAHSADRLTKGMQTFWVVGAGCLTHTFNTSVKRGVAYANPNSVIKREIRRKLENHFRID